MASNLTPNEFYEWNVNRASERMKSNKLMNEHEAVERFVQNGSSLVCSFSSFTLGPASLIRAIIRQQKKDLRLITIFTLLDSALLFAGGCLKTVEGEFRSDWPFGFLDDAGVEVGFLGLGKSIGRAVSSGKLKLQEWTNGTLAWRLRAGVMNISSLQTKSLLETDTLTYSSAKEMRCPLGGDKYAMLPALHPEVTFIHVHQADEFGNARIFGPDPIAKNAAIASLNTIISAEEIVSNDEIRKNPALTTIWGGVVDAVVEAPFGSYPGGVQGRYELDSDHVSEFMQAESNPEDLQKYLDRYIFKVDSHAEFLELIGEERLQRLQDAVEITEGYRP